jgi:hypothetical protein
MECIRARLPVHSCFGLAAALALLACGCANIPAPGRTGVPSARHTEPLFNGRDLTGWNGDPRIWSVENGAIVGKTTADNPLIQHTFLIWDAGRVDDFTLRLEFRVTNGNSGVQYRSRVVEGWTVQGYQADLDSPNNTYTGGLYDERGRLIVARPGQRVVIEPDGRVDVVGQVGDTAVLRKNVRGSDWNTVEITAIGNRLVHRVNGRVTVDVTDNQPGEREDSGIIAFQLHTGAPMQAEFRDVVLTRLAPAAAR